MRKQHIVHMFNVCERFATDNMFVHKYVHPYLSVSLNYGSCDRHVLRKNPHVPYGGDRSNVCGTNVGRPTLHENDVLKDAVKIRLLLLIFFVIDKERQFAVSLSEGSL